MPALLTSSALSGIDERRPVVDRFTDHRDDLVVDRLALAERQFQADLVVGAAAAPDRLQQFFRRDAAVLVVGGGERPVAALVHRRLLDVDDRRLLREGLGPGIGVDVGRIARGDVAMVDVDHHLHRNGHAGRVDLLVQRPAALDRVAEFAADRHRLPEQIGQPGRLGVLGDLAPAFERDVEEAERGARDRR